jgi:hypothetical protein
VESQPLTDVKSMVLVSHRGKLSDIEAFSQPFHREVGAGLREAGLHVEWEGGNEPSFDVPAGSFPPHTGHQLTNVVAVDDMLVIGVAIFIGSSAGQWAVGKVLDEVYAGRIRPAVGHLLNRVRGSVSRPQTLRIRTDYYFDDYHKVVRIEIDASGRHKPDMTKVDKALKQARDLIEQGAVAKHALLYRLANGQLTGPEFTDQLPAD